MKQAQNMLTMKVSSLSYSLIIEVVLVNTKSNTMKCIEVANVHILDSIELLIELFLLFTPNSRQFIYNHFKIVHIAGVLFIFIITFYCCTGM